MSRPRHVASVLRLAKQAANTKAVLKRWAERPWADSGTREDRAFAQIVEWIDSLDNAITEACGEHDAKAKNGGNGQ